MIVESSKYLKFVNEINIGTDIYVKTLQKFVFYFAVSFAKKSHKILGESY